MSNKVTFVLTLTNAKPRLVEWMQKRLATMADSMIRYGARATLNTTVEVDDGKDKDS